MIFFSPRGLTITEWFGTMRWFQRKHRADKLKRQQNRSRADGPRFFSPPNIPPYSRRMERILRERGVKKMPWPKVRVSN